MHFWLPSIIITITSNEPWNTETHKTDRNPPITDHKPWPFEPVKAKFCFLRGPLRWLTAAKNANVSWFLNFRVRVFMKSAVNQGFWYNNYPRYNKLISPVPWHSVKSRFHSTVELHQLMTSWSTNAVKPLLSSVHLFACSLKTLKFCDIYPRDLLLWTLRLCKQYLLCCHSVWTMTNMTKIF